MAFRRFHRAARWWILIALGLAILGWGLTRVTQWPLVTSIKHLAAFPACDLAGAAALAPASEGQPGYWRHLDKDADGVACEPSE